MFFSLLFIHRERCLKTMNVSVTLIKKGDSPEGHPMYVIRIGEGRYNTEASHRYRGYEELRDKVRMIMSELFQPRNFMADGRHEQRRSYRFELLKLTLIVASIVDCPGQVKGELGMKQIAVADFPGKFPKQAYGMPLNDADCEERCKVRDIRNDFQPTCKCLPATRVRIESRGAPLANVHVVMPMSGLCRDWMLG